MWYRVTASLDAAGVDALASRLSEEERSRAARFVFARDRRDFVAAHALVRDTLGVYESVPPEGWTFESGDNGKPHLPLVHAGTPPLAFNLSHTHGLVAIGVGRGVDIGVDVETVEPIRDREGVAERSFSRAEQAGLAACSDAERPIRFVELWTLKEAYLKATGQGLMEPLDAFGFVFEGARGLRFEAPAGATVSHWTFALFAPLPLVRMAVAIRSSGGEPRPILVREVTDEMTACAVLRTTGVPPH